ncbi:MAG: FtsX-like permease family protein [Bacteroidota bacterium]
MRRNEVGNFNFQGFALLTEGTSLDALHIKVDDLVKEYRGDDGGTSFEFQPITEKRLYGDFENGKNVGGRITYVRIFSVVAIFLLLIACINFMNLATARSSKRAKEIGIRKVVGGTRTSLIAQFFGESIFMALLALIVAIFLTSLLMPGFNLLTGKEMSLPVGQVGYWFAAILIAILAGLFAGSYPALLLSSFPIVSVVKGMFRLGWQNVTLRRVLVVFQFALSIFLIISTIVIYRQLNYIQTKNIGLDKEWVLSVRLPQFSDKRMKFFRQKLENQAGVISITASDQNPLSVGNSTTTVDWDEKGEEEEIMFHGMRIGYDFVETFRIDLVSGRDFDLTYGMDSANYLINEQTMHTIGWNSAEEAVGQNLALWGKQGKVIGVMKDFHIASFYTAIEPLILTLEPWNTGQVFVRLKPGELSGGIESVESAFSELSPAYPFRYTFVDQQFNKMYLSETMMGRLATTSAILGIFIACLGLLGLAAFTAEQRTKEIGIRKVLGASVAELVVLLGKEFTWLVLIALAFAVPLAIWLLSGWLEEFTYRIPVEPWVHVIGGLSALLIAWGTIGYQAVKTATQDPAKALRTE